MAGKGTTHEQILDAAERLFERYGPIKASLADIARELSMSPPNIYNFFPSKDALLEAVGGRHFASLKEKLLAHAATPADPWERVKTMVITVVRDMSKRLQDEKDILQIHVIARKNDWKFIDDFDVFLKDMFEAQIRELTVVRKLAGVDAAADAAALFDCISCMIHPFTFARAQFTAEERVRRIQAQMTLLERAFR